MQRIFRTTVSVLLRSVGCIPKVFLRRLLWRGVGVGVVRSYELTTDLQEKEVSDVFLAKVLICDIKPFDACVISVEGKDNVEKTIPVSLQNLQGCTQFYL